MEDMRNCRAIVRYAGTRFSGWQIQLGERTVQGDIMGALERISGCPVPVHGASRTDAGVHALAQVCSFHWPASADVDKLRRSLSSMLSPDIRIEALDIAPAEFHARKSAKAKRYSYVFDTGREPDPFLAPFVWTAHRDTDVDLLREICGRLEGEHDFAGFESSRAAPKHSTVRTLYRVSLEEGGVVFHAGAKNLWRLEYFGNGFLYKMVRNMTGTLMDIARGHHPQSRLADVLAMAGPYHGYTAPAHGLTLMEVLY
jgi:tRNA pseudouridine38-40 synthase